MSCKGAKRGRFVRSLTPTFSWLPVWVAYFRMLNRQRFLVTLFAAAIAVSACKKESFTEASGTMGKDEAALFAHLPGEAAIVFGGSYVEFMEYWENSPLKDLSTMLAKVQQDDSAKFGEYMNCWVENGKKSRLAGTVALQAGTLQMNMVFAGLGAKELGACADKVGIEVKVDSDGKYLELKNVPDGMGGINNIGYYLIDDDTVFFSMRMPLGLGLAAGRLPRPSRKEMEAVLESAKNNSAANSDQIKRLSAKADRSKDFWFAGSAAGTPAAIALKEGTGWIDTDKTSMTFGFDIVLSKASMAKEAVDAFKEAPNQLGMAPPEIRDLAKDFLKKAKLKNDGGKLTGKFVIENELLEKLAPIIKQMNGL